MLLRCICSAIALVTIGFAALPANAQSQSPAPRPGDLPVALRRVLGVELNRDSLASVQQRLGPAHEWTTGDGGNAQVWWCFRTGVDSDAAVLLISSSDEMGGPGHEVDEIRLTRSARADPLGARCAPAVSTRGVRPSSGLRLGLDRRAIVQLLGAPLVQAGDSVAYAWETTEPLPPTSPIYARWNARRKECFGGKPPFVGISSGAVVRFDRLGASDIFLYRYDESIC
jgi:hypothetical protein